MRKIFWITSITIFLCTILSIPHVIYAQEQKGTISGTVYRDINANGVCVNEGEPRVAANLPMELVLDDVGELVRLTTVADGSYIYDTDALGLWRVTVVPGESWRVTSQQTLEVVLTPDSPNATVDFCIIEVNQSSGGGGTTLPESGAPVAPALLMAATIGFILIAAGAGLLLFNRLRME